MSVTRVPGETFGRYVIEAELGRGGQAVVHRARQHGTERSVALKIFDEIDDAAKRARFLREAVAAARVEHPRIVTVYESGEVEGVPFLAMRLVPGPSLAEVLSRFGAVPPSRALAILQDVADAVDAAHASGLVHRDIKPANVLLDLDDRAFLSDFGVARLEDLPRLTVRGDWLGTAEYISPEQAEGRPATAASDIYSFGVLAFEVLGGRPPFVHRQMTALLVAHARDEPPSIRTVNEALPAEVDTVLGRALAKDPAARPPTARRVVDALRDVLDGMDDGPGATLVGPAPSDGWTRVMRRFTPGDAPEGATRVIPPPAPPAVGPPPPPRRRRGRGRAVTTGLLALLVLGGAGVAAGWYAAESTARDPESVRVEAYRQGFANGKARGVAQGRRAGETAGRRAGEQAGRAAGLEEGRRQGYREGLDEGRRVPDADPGDFRLVRADPDGFAEYVTEVLEGGSCFRIEDDGSVRVIGSANPFSVCAD